VRRGAGWALAATCALALGCGEPRSRNSRRGDLHLELSESEPPVRQGSMSFGDVPVGTSARRTIQLHNTGTDRAVVTQVRFEDAAPGTFFVQAPDAVQEGEKRPLTVTFAPAQAGSYEARLVVEHDGITQSATLHLVGQAL
jgi:hypothetical protein